MGGKLGATPRFGKAAEPSIAKVNGLNLVARQQKARADRPGLSLEGNAGLGQAAGL
jgi:hypothetical protein